MTVCNYFLFFKELDWLYSWPDQRNGSETKLFVSPWFDTHSQTRFEILREMTEGGQDTQALHHCDSCARREAREERASPLLGTEKTGGGYNSVLWDGIYIEEESEIMMDDFLSMLESGRIESKLF